MLPIIALAMSVWWPLYGYPATPLGPFVAAGRQTLAEEALLEKLPQLRNQLLGPALALAEKATVPIDWHRDGQALYRWREPKHAALLAIADRADARAISVLLSNLEYHNHWFLFGERMGALDQRFPAADALVKIGRPAMGPVLDKLKQTDKNGRIRHNLCWVLETYYGQNIARRILTEELDKTYDERLRRNLTAALLEYFFP